MTDRDRMIELIHDSDYSLDSVRLADYLIANGVILPPCKVGDKIYWVIDNITDRNIKEFCVDYDEETDFGVCEFTVFKCYIYCTKARELFSYGGGLLGASDQLYRLPTDEIKFGDSIELMCCDDEYSKDNFLNGKIIGEFVCDEIIEILPDNEIYGTYDISDDEVIASCLVNGDLWNYGRGKTLYGFHISDLVIYDKPKELNEFEKPHEYIYQSYKKQNSFFKGVTRPPQSWCYVEELK